MSLFEHFPYTNFHNLNLDWLLTQMKELATQMEALTAQVTALAQQVSTLATQLQQLASTVSDISTRLTTAEGKITTLENNIQNPTYITDNSWIVFSADTGTIIRSTWARVNADKSVDFMISCGWQTSAAPWSETITATINWNVIGGTFKPLEQWWILYATDIGLGADPGVIGRAYQNTSGIITLELSDENEISFAGRFYLN